MTINILVTGANGFVGSRLMAVDLPHNASIRLRGALRSGKTSSNKLVNTVCIDAIGPTTSWTEALMGMNVVVHLAARVHILDEGSADAISEYRFVNVQGTLNLARQAAAAGVRRFIFLSSIKVNGEATFAGQAFSEDSLPNPSDPYGISKHEAEEGLKALCEQTGMEYVIIRPPLIYGPGVKANYQNLIQLVKRGIPIPLGSVSNKRSMLALDNLINFIILVADDPRAANQTFLLSDGQDLSSAELVMKIARALRLAPRLWSMPKCLLHMLGFAAGRRSVVQRLCGSLQIDSSKARKLLNWTPPIGVDEGILRAVAPMLTRSKRANHDKACP